MGRSTKTRRSRKQKGDTTKNKIYALLLMGIGLLSAIGSGEGTFFVFTLIFGVPLLMTSKPFIE